MANFARIEDGIVTQVIAVNNEDAPTEEEGVKFLTALYGEGIIWKQTSYASSANFHPGFGDTTRKNYAGIGYTYDEERNAFIAPQPYPSWVLNELKGMYFPPIPEPDNNFVHKWNEDLGQWEHDLEHSLPSAINEFYTWDENILAWVEKE